MTLGGRGLSIFFRTKIASNPQTKESDSFPIMRSEPLIWDASSREVGPMNAPMAPLPRLRYR